MREINDILHSYREFIFLIFKTNIILISYSEHYVGIWIHIGRPYEHRASAREIEAHIENNGEREARKRREGTERYINIGFPGQFQTLANQIRKMVIQFKRYLAKCVYRSFKLTQTASDFIIEHSISFLSDQNCL